MANKTMKRCSSAICFSALRQELFPAKTTTCPYCQSRLESITIVSSTSKGNSKGGGKSGEKTISRSSSGTTIGKKTRKKARPKKITFLKEYPRKDVGKTPDRKRITKRGPSKRA